MDCLPVQLPGWLPRWVQSIIPPSDNDNFWDNQEVPPEMRAGDTACEAGVIKSPASAPYQTDTEREYQSQLAEASLGKDLPQEYIVSSSKPRFYSRHFPSRVHTVFPKCRHGYTPRHPDSSKGCDTPFERKESWFAAASLSQLLKTPSPSER